MKFYEVRRRIAATPEIVWAILTDAVILQSGDFGILRISGGIREGSKLKLWSEVDPKRAFALQVAVFDAPCRMEWSGDIPFGLFTGRRQFELREEGCGTGFLMREEFSGLMSEPIIRSMPDLQPGFEKFGDALKRKAKEQR